MMADKGGKVWFLPTKDGIRVFEPSPSKTPVKGAWFKKEIFDGGGRCRFLIRRTLAVWRGWDLYLHHWVNDDWSEHLHDHSRHMLSIGLCGSYTEWLDGGVARRWRAPWVRFFRATHRHRVVLNSPSVWTLIVAWPNSRHSAFFVDGQRVTPNRYFRSAWAQQQKRC